MSEECFVHNHLLDRLKIFEHKTRWYSWLRHFATSHKVAGSIPDGVIGNFLLTYGTTELGLTQPLTEMSTWNISWEVKAAGA